MCSLLKAHATAAATDSKSFGPTLLNKGAVSGQTGFKSRSHHSLLHKAGLSFDILALLPEPALIVRVLCEVVMHKDVIIESVAAIVALIAALLRR